MTDDTDAGPGWFSDVEPGDTGAAADAITGERTERPDDWPTLAVETGFAGDEEEYYDRLHEATVEATRQEVQAREHAGDQQLIHAVRAMDDAGRVGNELAERVDEWAGALGLAADAGDPVERARAVAAIDPDGPGERRLRSLAERTAGLLDERDDLREHVERTAPTVAPNLSALAGPVLAARLIALAGSLESLAKMPSGTVQVLGAEDALFAHLRGNAPSPKHGVIYTHDYVRGTHPDHRGSAARAVAGKLTIAARVDHYAGDRRPDLDRQLDERIARIRSRGEDDE